MFYIQRKDARQLETVDQFDSRREALDMVREYRMADHSANYYISSRACKEWADSEHSCQ